MPALTRHYIGDKVQKYLPMLNTETSSGEFNPDKEYWISYTELLVQFFAANSITAEGNTRYTKSSPAQFVWCSHLSVN